MKKVSLIALLAIGINGLIATETENKPKVEVDPGYGNAGYHLMTEDELLLELNDEGAKQYESLDAEGKLLAIKVASTRCAGSNACADPEGCSGLNACADEKHSCAGKGTKGEGKCAVADKNMAVRLVAERMAKKRALLEKKKEAQKVEAKPTGE